MPSTQEMETKINVLEDKIDFLMNLMRMSTPSLIQGAPPKVVSMLDLYLSSKGAGLTIVPASEQNNG